VTHDGLKLLAVDDERPQLEDLARILRSLPEVDEVQCAHDGRDALLKATTHGYDAIFIDFRMPELDGLELARILKRFADPPQIVFVSAHDNAAVDAFELHALDYLRKPVSRRRIEEAVERVVSAIETRHTPLSDDVVAVANIRGGGRRLIKRGEILYVQAHGDYVRIITADNRHLLRATLAEIERRWETFGFVRVHRQYVANLHLATEVRPLLGGTADLVFPGGHEIPIARRHLPGLRRRLEL
jgi:DNA-binding LytR/AlgR family response regulator